MYLSTVSIFHLLIIASAVQTSALSNQNFITRTLLTYCISDLVKRFLSYPIISTGKATKALAYTALLCE